MNNTVHLVTLSLVGCLFVIGAYHRIQSAKSGDKLDRTKEGVPVMIAIRLVALFGFAQIVYLMRDPQNALSWAKMPAMPGSVPWLGVALTALAAAWLTWMFVSLGKNLTDTVEIRREAHFVDWGPYRYVRNPMYTGLLTLGIGLGLAFERWSIAVTFAIVFLLLAIRTRREEQYLIARFGDQYKAYMQRVGRFFPVLH